MTTVEAYYTIYYGFRRYRYNAKPPVIGRRKVAKKLGIPYKNIDVGITGELPMWTPGTRNKLLLWIGRRLNVKIPHVIARLQQLVAEAMQKDPALTQKAAEKLVVGRYL